MQARPGGPKGRGDVKKLAVTGVADVAVSPIKSHLRDTIGIRNPKRMWTGRLSRPLLFGQGSNAAKEIRQRMAALAEEEGLAQVDDLAPEYLQSALQYHMLRILRSVPPVRTQPPPEEPFLTLAQPGKKREREESSLELIGAPSLVVGVQQNGKKLLRDDLPVQQEKILLFASQ